MSDKQIEFNAPAAPLEVISATDMEYQQANEWWRKISDMRRHDLAAFTAIQGAAVTVIGDNLLDLEPHHFLLSLVAFVLLAVGYNAERRLAAFLQRVKERSRAIEKQRGMALLSEATQYIEHTRGIVSTAKTFGAFYITFAMSWVVVWIINIVA